MTTDFVRGNLKKVLLLLMLTFCAAGVYAQSSMSDSQVMEYIAKEYQKGTSQAQIVTKLMQNGVQISQIRRVRDQYQRMKKNTSMGAADGVEQGDDRSRTNNGQVTPGKDKLSRQQVAEQTMQDYNQAQMESNQYSTQRLKDLRDQKTANKKYDETDPEFILMQQELNGILPGDTAQMYEELGGFIAIGSIFPSAWNWQDFWSKCAFISIILAIMNILPIPGLDGGHAIFTLWEMITGRKPSDRFLEAAQYVGLAIILVLLVYANGNDIYRFFIK